MMDDMYKLGFAHGVFGHFLKKTNAYHQGYDKGHMTWHKNPFKAEKKALNYLKLINPTEYKVFKALSEEYDIRKGF